MHADKQVFENNVCPYCGYVPPFASFRPTFYCPACCHEVDIDEVRQ